MPNTCRTPSAASAATIHSPPVRGAVSLFIDTTAALRGDGADRTAVGTGSPLVSCRQDGLHGRPRHRGQGPARRRVSVVQDKGPTAVGGRGQARVERNPPEQRKAVLGGRRLRARALEERAHTPTR